jgi:hypothetical protein
VLLLRWRSSFLTRNSVTVLRFSCDQSLLRHGAISEISTGNKVRHSIVPIGKRTASNGDRHFAEKFQEALSAFEKAIQIDSSRAMVTERTLSSSIFYWYSCFPRFSLSVTRDWFMSQWDRRTTQKRLSVLRWRCHSIRSIFLRRQIEQDYNFFETKVASPRFLHLHHL